MASIHKLIGEIIRAGARLAADRNELMLGFRVTGAGLRLLKTIRMVRHPMPITGLARIMRVSRQTVRETARHLERAGFIAVESDPWNSRACLVSLTQSGRERLEILMRLERRWAKGLGRGFAEPVRAQTAWVLCCVRERCTRMPRSEEWDTVPALPALRPQDRGRSPEQRAATHDNRGSERRVAAPENRVGAPEQRAAATHDNRGSERRVAAPDNRVGAPEQRATAPANPVGARGQQIPGPGDPGAVSGHPAPATAIPVAARCAAVPPATPEAIDRELADLAALCRPSARAARKPVNSP
jgi:DNA-binding MarR family transcriptional regulator